MRKSLLTLCILVAVAALSRPLLHAFPMKYSSTLENTVTEDRKLSGFKKMEVSGAFEIKLVKSNSYSVNVVSEEKDLARTKTIVNGDKLIISYDKEGKDYYNRKYVKITVIVETPELNALTCSGAVEVAGTGNFESDKFELKTSGATEVEMELTAKLLISKFSGATEVKLKGKVDTHALEMTGASELEAVNLEVSKYAIESKGAADCKIFVKEELAVSGSGASSIKYKGSPTKISKDTRGAADISAL
jgi:hypothetical protein